MSSRKIVKSGIYLALGFFFVPSITSLMVTISGGIFAVLLDLTFFAAMKMIPKMGYIGAIVMLIGLILAPVGFIWLWNWLNDKGILSVRGIVIKKLDISKNLIDRTQSLETIWLIISMAASLIAYLLVGLYYFFESLRPAHPSPGSVELSQMAKYAVSIAYKECAHQIARGENFRNLSYPNFANPQVKNYIFLPKSGSCEGNKKGNIIAKSNDEELNPSFSINSSTGYTRCRYSGKDQENHKCIDGTW